MRDTRCKCSVAISMIGDGCRYCQPQEHIDRISEWLDEEREEVTRLQAAHEEELFCVRQSRDTHFGGMMRALEQVDALQAENAQLRAAIRRLCNIYVVDDYYMGKQREEMLDSAVNRAIERVKEPPK